MTPIPEPDLADVPATLATFRVAFETWQDTTRKMQRNYDRTEAELRNRLAAAKTEIQQLRVEKTAAEQEAERLTQEVARLTLELEDLRKRFPVKHDWQPKWRSIATVEPDVHGFQTARTCSACGMQEGLAPGVYFSAGQIFFRPKDGARPTWKRTPGPCRGKVES
jgi:hypothetical protein